jgi:hypothetical protein
MMSLPAGSFLNGARHPVVLSLFCTVVRRPTVVCCAFSEFFADADAGFIVLQFLRAEGTRPQPSL